MGRGFADAGKLDGTQDELVRLVSRRKHIRNRDFEASIYYCLR